MKNEKSHVNECQMIYFFLYLVGHRTQKIHEYASSNKEGETA